jgi:hypothetical protein
MRPGPHGDIMPHMHEPLLQVSAPAPQSLQLMPLAAQCIESVAMQVVPFTQHPLQPDVALHTHAPPTHFVPVGHGAPVPPHTHLPAGLQVSAVPLMVQSRQFKPIGAHWVPLSGVWHTPFVQQPLQLPELQPEHMPASVQLCEPGQLWQVLCWPQAPAVLPVWHVLPSLEQQPAHSEVSHMQLPITQRRPAPHAMPVPHAHEPALQLSAPGPHGWHAWPAGLHADVDIGLHAPVLLSQQPDVHEAALHLHVPVPGSQYWPTSQGRPSAPQTQPIDG